MMMMTVLLLKRTQSGWIVVGEAGDEEADEVRVLRSKKHYMECSQGLSYNEKR